MDIYCLQNMFDDDGNGGVSGKCIVPLESVTEIWGRGPCAESHLTTPGQFHRRLATLASEGT